MPIRCGPRSRGRVTSGDSEAFHRIEALTEIDGRMKVIDIKIDVVRETVLIAKQNAIDLYRSAIAVDYGLK